MVYSDNIFFKYICQFSDRHLSIRKKRSVYQNEKSIIYYFLSTGAIMILSASSEFDRTRNPVIIDRPSDNIELPKVSFSKIKNKSK